MPRRLSPPTSSMSELGVRIAQQCWKSGLVARLENSVDLDNPHPWPSPANTGPAAGPRDAVAFYDTTGRQLGELRLGGGTPLIIVHNAGFEPQAGLLAQFCRNYCEVKVVRPYMARQSRP